VCTPYVGARLDVEAVREHFTFPDAGRIVTNNAASTQPPRELLDLFRELGTGYENVHRGQSAASRSMTGLFESAYDTIAEFIGAPGRESIALYRNTTEAINAVMYSLLTEFRDGDNVVTTMLEHNSNYVPWHALAREILPGLGRRVECRLARFDPVTGELDLGHLASLVDERTKLVCCTGASNFLGSRPDLAAVRDIAIGQAGTRSPTGSAARACWSTRRSWCRGPSQTWPRSTRTTWRSPSTRCWRRSASACCTPGRGCCAPRRRSCTGAT
jgi:cysteine desulfurase/selenocysteine lyase